LAPLIKLRTEAALVGGIDSHLANEVATNRRNGKTKRKVKGTSGELELETPRDRAGTFEPQLAILGTDHDLLRHYAASTASALPNTPARGQFCT